MSSPIITLCESNHPDIKSIRELRHRILRAPWNIPSDHDWDPGDEPTYTGLVMNANAWINKTLVATGRIHQSAPGLSQVRYMAIDDNHQRQGLGRQVLQALEATAAEWKTEKIFLNARELAIPFYLNQGYEDVAPADILFGTIIHRRMEKVIRS